ncbi:MAG: hypothetical protein ACOY0T_18160 [Myxococcota bacterium]
MQQRVRASATLGPLMALAFGVTLACSPASSSSTSASGGRSSGSSAGGNSSFASGGQTSATQNGGTTGIMVGNSGGQTNAGAPSVQACVSQATAAQPAPLDIYILLDSSLSMLDRTPAGTTKWDAVKSAISAFFQDSGSAGLSVGLQFFPLRKPNVPARCSNNSECGAGGPCTLKACSKYGQLVSGGLAACSADSDCSSIPTLVDYGTCNNGACSKDSNKRCNVDADCRISTPFDFGPCAPLGRCSNASGVACSDINASCGKDTQGNDRGTCLAATSSYCFHGSECTQAAYAKPAVEIQALPAASNALLASLQAQEPDGDTPTGPALRGAIAHAREWANAHPGHTVVAVLATDGLPTECLPDNVSFAGTTPLDALMTEVTAVAADGLKGAPSIATFVIGVFSSADTQAPANLERMAQAGGTKKAQIVDTSGDVSQQFLAALNTVRASRLACEFQIPAPTGGAKLNYFEVNVAYKASGNETSLFYVGSPDRCDPNLGGWYYDDLKGVAPSKILVCPSNCDTFKSTNGSVAIQLGCATAVK